MASREWTVDISGIDRLTTAMEQYSSKSGKVIQEYLAKDGFDRIARHIPDLLHASGRDWIKKPKSATEAGYNSVFQGSVSDLSLTVRTKSRYNYLYFPDDGSNTKNHVGNQQFMRRGAEDVTDDMVSGIVARLVAAFES